MLNMRTPQFRVAAMKPYSLSSCCSFILWLLAFSTNFIPIQADPNHVQDTIDWVNTPIANVDGFFPTPWQCFASFGDPDPGTQSMLQFHYNWHCTHPFTSEPNWGNRFFGFHKQFLFGYDRFLASKGEAFIQTWEARPRAKIPPPHGDRMADTPCDSCQQLPSRFQPPPLGTLDTSFTTVTQLGDDIGPNWHDPNHGAIATASGHGLCPGGGADMGCIQVSPNDPIFYRYHHIFDDIQDAWRTFQPTDIAIVLDRSGSMSLPASGGSRLDVAKNAANLFASLLTLPADGKNNKVGMVSFATTA
jgi:hypothetical protein